MASIKTEKPKKYQKVSVIIPAYNEEETVATVVDVVKKVSFVDEIIVVNDGSSDNTSKEAIKAGARVINHDVNKGKGEALFTGYSQAECDIIAFIDADIHNLTSSKVHAMIKPILDGKTDITKTKFSRASGRVTELTAKPLLNFFFPEISFEQPLSGQFAARKEVLKRINFEKDYGVDVGIVIDADVLGISVMEVDIGEIEHDMSPLADLNLMANEVVRTIINRANKYGRIVMIDDIGDFIRMSIVGLSLIILGLFTIFFVKFVPLTIGVIVLLLMISTFIGASHFENGVLSIEPNSRNLIIYADDTPSHVNNTISVRGPYTIDTAIENESSKIRLPSDAMMTLGINAGDSLIIDGDSYKVKNTREGEPDILRVPINVKNELSVENGDIIQSSRLNQIFSGITAIHNIKLPNETLTEKFTYSPREINATTFEIIVNNESITNTTGIFKENTSYDISVNNEVVKRITCNNGFEGENTSFAYDDYKVDIVFKENNVTSIKQFVKQDEGNFLNFKFK